MILRKSRGTGLATFLALLLCGLWACGQGSKTHTVTLTWKASKSVVKGYNVYRGTKSGGPYTKINSNLVTGLTYVDKDVRGSTTYYYVTRSVDADGRESVNSGEITATVP
jgi:fibronectin type 3 domain-containing protein